jgi:hypothetical protein
MQRRTLLRPHLAPALQAKLFARELRDEQGAAQALRLAVPEADGKFIDAAYGRAEWLEEAA